MPPIDTGPPLPRHQFPVADDLVYLDTAHATPLPLAAAEAVARDAHDAARRGSVGLDERFARLAPLRSAVGSLVGSGADDVALVANTTQGLGLVAAGLDWRPGDRILVPAGDHPTTILPWRVQERRGATVAPVAPGPSVLDALLGALDATPDVRVVALSWVQAHDGERTDLAALAGAAHERGALLCVDAIQGLGAVPADLIACGADAVAAGAQKWLLGPHGIGALVVTAEMRDRLALVTASKGSLADGADGGPLVPLASAARFEAGAPAHAGAAAWGAGLALLADAGIDAVWAWVDRLCDRLAAGAEGLGLEVLSPRGRETRSSLVTVAVPGVAPERAVARLAAAGVVASSRGAGVRFSPHGWNDDADVDAALAAMASL